LKEDIETKDQAVTAISFEKAELEKKIDVKISKLGEVTAQKDLVEKKSQQLSN
jgi:chromosome segregation ATPase